NTVNFKYVLGRGNWLINNLNASVYVTGNAVIYVPATGNVNVSGNDMIYIAPGLTNSLTMFVGVPTANLGGKGIVNATGNALGFEYLGLPSNTTLKFSANAAFAGVVYCPNAAFTLGGGGSDTYDFVGASVSNTVKMNGHFRFHYDENLRRKG